MRLIALPSCMLVCASLLLSACGKKKTEESVKTAPGQSEKKVKPAAGGQSPKQAGTPASEPFVAAEIPPEVPVTLVMTLNSLVKEFVARNNRPPENLEELVKKGMLPRLPKPPPGKRFELTKDAAGKPLVVEVP
ncbi:MAG: hypothetical protein WCS99_03385 [Limisphaerales bacterium]